MIITDTLGSAAAIDARFRSDPNALEAPADELARRVIAKGEDSGAFIRRESVWVTITDEEVGPLIFRMEAIWSPDPTKGVILVGGPNDGGVVEVPRQSDGRPAERVHVSPPAANPYRDPSTWPEPNHIGSYVRHGIDSERDVWVYRWV